MKLTLKREIVEQLLSHSETAAKHNPTITGPHTAVPGLWLCGDRGVYLMSNANPTLAQATDATRAVVAYANEVNPETMVYIAWTTNKRLSFGDKDGFDVLLASQLRKALGPAGTTGPLALEVKPTSIGIYYAIPESEDLVGA